MLETTFHSLTAVLIVMFMVAVGWLFGKLGYLRREHKKLMTKLIISAAPGRSVPLNPQTPFIVLGDISMVSAP